MTNLEKYRSLLHDGVQGLLLTSRYSRMYAAEFDIAEGVAVVSAQGARYFTDSRYIESAENNLKGYEVLMTDAEHTYSQRLNDAIADFGVKTLGFEESFLTVAEFEQWKKTCTPSLSPCRRSWARSARRRSRGSLSG